MARIRSSTVYWAKHSTDEVVIFPTALPNLRSLAVSRWRRTPILSTSTRVLVWSGLV
ncbi:hypothetical protein CSOJ01_14607 [Colletotrichum sojae]|uniref:Uncharacterized protein n=1 Tax=Colletotrichum sojae TaxID=2175907 RepID=A0A8H6MJ50_9PEZI|nr:hypothetical protein CSOJ01_14607 [Colletotrichum sojae]